MIAIMHGTHSDILMTHGATVARTLVLAMKTAMVAGGSATNDCWALRCIHLRFDLLGSPDPFEPSAQ